MPINRKLCPQDWHRISRTVRDHFDWTCQACRQPMRQPGEPLDTHKRTLTCAHLDHDPLNWTDARLTALCAPCHLRYDNSILFEPVQSEDRLPGVEWEIPFVRMDVIRAALSEPAHGESVETSSPEGAAV